MSDVVEVLRQEVIAFETVAIDVVDVGVQGLPGIQGPRGFSGPPGTSLFEMVAGVALGGHRFVYLDERNQLQYATNAVLAHAARIVGMTVGAVNAGEVAQVKSMGDIVEPSWAWDTTKPVYLGINGLLTQEVPAAPTAKFSMVVGFPISSTSLFVNPSQPIVLSN